MQAASDIFLGYENRAGPRGAQRQFYVRQLRDGKVSAEISEMGANGLSMYAELCVRSLARAHACSGDRIAIAACLGAGPSFDRAMADFACAYADQNDLDHGALLQAIEQGRIPAEFGV